MLGYWAQCQIIAYKRSSIDADFTASVTEENDDVTSNSHVLEDIGDKFLQAMALIFSNPALGDLVNRHWIEIMQLLAPAPDHSDQVRRLQQPEMLGHRLTRHIEVFA